MNFYTDDRPIIACSTGTTSNTAIAVIRISGFKKLSDLQIFFSLDLTSTKSRQSYLTNIIFRNQVFDNGLLVFFPEKKSYTGENVLEISVHGNQLNIQRILNLLLKEGDFRLAHPGEFTYRALKNKKLNLSQVEGLDMLLNANSNLMLTQGLELLQGDLHAQYLALYQSFLKIKAAVEISIDFSEDVGIEESAKLFEKSFNDFFKLISSLKTRTEGNISEVLSPEIALVGQTNAGKSSLFNILLSHDRSIVSNIAGTTRDYVSEIIHIDGINFKLVDTAGIRESRDAIENIGIERAMTILKRSFYKILVVNPFETDPIYLQKFSDVTFDILLLSHSDQKQFKEKYDAINFSGIKTRHAFAVYLKNLNNGPIEPLLDFGPMGPKIISGPMGPPGAVGPIEPLLDFGPIEPVLKYFISNKFKTVTANNPILIERHRDTINKIYNNTAHIKSNISTLHDAAILSSEVNILGHSLTELIGIVSPEDVLNSIFANFCIGK